MKRTVSVLLYLFAMMPLAGHAQIIMCKDASGKTHTSDRPIMECADRPIREFGNSGVLKREIPAPLTAEQKRQKQLEEEKRKAEELTLIEQRQSDRAMLARYRNEGDIGMARERTLEIIQEQMKRQAEALAAAEKRHKDTQLEIAQLKGKTPVPPVLQHQMEESDRALRNEKKKLHAYQAEIVQIHEKFDATLTRYRELSSRQSTASK